MSGIYYTEMANWCRAAGLKVVEYAGWQTRARSSGGFKATPLGVQWHHTAGSGSSPQGDCDYMWKNSDSRPVGNMYLARDGTVWIGAAGASNTAGKGGPYPMSRGTVPSDQGNTTTWAIEAANNGVGQEWPAAQIDAYFKLNELLNSKFGNKVTDLFTHADYTLKQGSYRKIDPATAAAVSGSWKPRSVNSSGTWNVDDIKAEATRRAGGTPPVPPDPPPSGGTYTVVAGDSWWAISQKYGITVDELVALNPPATSSTVIHPGDVLNVPGGVTPPDPPTPPPDTGGYDWMATMPTIKKGDSGDYVERMQHLLAAAGFMNPANTSNYDGKWGSGTDSAKAKFDSAHGLGGSDTSCGPKSWESLMTGRVW